jgi:hypothetical protein
MLSVACVVALGSGSLRAEAIPVRDVERLDPGPVPELVYLIETDKEVYQLGEEVLITHRAVNCGETDIKMRFLYAPAFEFFVLAGEERIEPWVQLRFTVIWGFRLSPGESYVTEWTWDMTDSEGTPLSPGTYEIVGASNGGPEPVLPPGGMARPDVPVASIAIIPEPGMLGLVSLAFGTLLRRKTG